MISVTEALDQLFTLAKPLSEETVPLTRGLGRVLARDVVTARVQPPFSASAMDGYAVTDARPGLSLQVIGESAAGHRFDGSVAAGQAVRIFTGAPIPEGTQCVVIQEDITRAGDVITLGQTLGSGNNIRRAGIDFDTGFSLPKGRLLTAQDIALLAAMNIRDLPVIRRPDVAILSTGDELVMPGDPLGPDQIIASNTFGLHALIAGAGGLPRILPIARDTTASLRFALEMSQNADLVLTIGGASVGDHDLVAGVTEQMGMTRAFYKIAMRPGKPLMSGTLPGSDGPRMMIGLPGNPVSAMVCGHIFVLPVIRAMMGLPATPAQRFIAPLAAPLAANGPREHYMRATLNQTGITAHPRQDSSLLSVLSASNALLVRPVDDGPKEIGDMVAYLPCS